jgi:hypothetical protein
MRIQTLARLALPAVAALALGARAEPAGGLRLRVDQPAVDALAAGSEGTLFVAGRALGFSGERRPFDVVIALDVSRSSAAASGADVDGDGELGIAPGGRFADPSSSDAGDSVLAAQVAAARALLAQIDPLTTRCALVTFAGRSGSAAPSARLRVALTRELSLLDAALDEVLAETPRGRTDIAAALDLAALALTRGGADSEPAPDVTRVVVLLSDGEPTLPFPLDPQANAQHALASARRLAASGIRVDSFAMESTGAKGARVAAALAAETGGRFSAVRDPAQLIAGFEDLHWTSLAALEIVNQTSGERAVVESLEGDGRFTALIPLVAGENWLVIRARASDGASAERRLRVRRVADAEPAALHARWLAPRRRLLETRLSSLRQRRLALEAQQAVIARQDWLRAMERTRRARSRSLSVGVEGALPGFPRTRDR